MTETDDALASFVRGLPKAELHVHLEGAVTPALARKLAARRGVRLPERLIQGAGGVERFSLAGIGEFVELYLAISSCFSQPEDFSEVIGELACDLAKQGVLHAEFTFTPVTHLERCVAPELILEGLAAGRAAASRQGVSLKWVFDIVRHLPEQAAPTLEFCRAMQRRDPGSVAGLGLGGPERPDTTRRYADVFSQARADGFWALPHAGEHQGAGNVADSVEFLGARRIGHGVRCLEDPKVVELLLERDVTLEVCPTSNVALGVCPSLAEHPLPRLLEAGLSITLASDDPGLFGTSLVEEYLQAARAFDLSRAQLEALAENSLKRARLSRDERKSLIARG